MHIVLQEANTVPGGGDPAVTAASDDATVTVEVEGQPGEEPSTDPPPGLADTGLSLLVLLLVAVALIATGLLIRRLADRTTRRGA